ncbi:hypothetical protein MMC31_007662 [Peltigera leucophlebia]|nr:hypothetical protein [Peltigera leucophlebia]
MALDVEKSPAATDHGGADESADEALKAFTGMDPGERHVLVVDAATNKRLLRRIDLYIMPVSTLKYHKFALSISSQQKKRKEQTDHPVDGRLTTGTDGTSSCV